MHVIDAVINAMIIIIRLKSILLPAAVMVVNAGSNTKNRVSIISKIMINPKKKILIASLMIGDL